MLNSLDKTRLLDELERCLDGWSLVAREQAPASDPRVVELSAQTRHLQSEASAAGFASIATHLEMLQKQAVSKGRPSDLSPTLVFALRELIRGARMPSSGVTPGQQQVSAVNLPQHGGARAPSTSGAAIRQSVAPSDPSQRKSNLERTRVLDGERLSIPQSLNAQYSQPEPLPIAAVVPHPQHLPSPKPGAVNPPPMLGASIFLQQNGPPELASQRGNSQPAVAQAQHGLQREPPARPPSLSPLSAPPRSDIPDQTRGLTPPPLLSQSIAFPQQLNEPASFTPAQDFERPKNQTRNELFRERESEHGPEASPRAPEFAGSHEHPIAAPVGSPNLRVRTMFGLRAFGARKSDPSLIGQQPPAIDRSRNTGSSPLLGLQRRSEHAVQQPAGVNIAGLPAAPRLLDHSLAGLPALAPSVNPPPTDDKLSSLALSPISGMRSALDVVGNFGRQRARNHRDGGSLPPPALLRNRERPGNTTRVIAIIGAVFALLLGGLTTLIIVLTRNPSDSKLSHSGPSASQGANPAQAASAPLPQSKLTTENETLRALLSQVHGKGKESAELSALVDEEASLLAGSLSPDKCKGSPTACQAMAATQASIIGAQGARRISRRRATGTTDQVRSRWLVGLKLPDIPVEDDPLVERSLLFYTENPVGRETFQSMLFRCGAYRDLIQSTLVRYELPAALWAIVFVESGCTPQATSPVGAAGLWQFMPATGRAYHLQIKDEVIDERRSPPKSTEAAARYLRDIRDKLLSYNEAGVWDLTFGAYNLGPFGMIARLERVAGTGVGFWDLVDAKMLPDETSMYAPAIQAVALILNNLQRFKFSTVQMRTPQLTSELEIPPGTRLSLIARAASMSTRDLRSMNLDISGESTPDLPNFSVQVPKDVVWQARDTLKDLMASQDQMDLCVPPTFDWGRERFTKDMAAACQRKLSTKGR